MDDRIARLRTHQRNISRYQNMLKTRLSDVELHFVEKRLSEERFKIAMLDSEDIWNIHPVDLPMCYCADGKFQLKTVMDEYPAFFRYTHETNTILDSHREFFDTMPLDSRSGAWGTDAVKFYAFYSLSSDGSYYNCFDIHRSTTQQYKRLKVFADRRCEEEESCVSNEKRRHA